MRLLGQFQACLLFFTKRFERIKKHQNVKQTIFTALKVFLRKVLLSFLFFVCLFLFCCLMFACECFYVRNLFVKKISRFKIVLITSNHYTTDVYPYQPTYWATIFFTNFSTSFWCHTYLFTYLNLQALIFICQNLFSSVNIIFICVHLFLIV